MKLLSISTDRKIFEKGSAVALRQVEYAKNYEEMHIIVFSDKSYSEISLGPNIWVYPTRSINRWMYIFDALKLGRFIVDKRKIDNITCQDPFETGIVGALIKSRHDIKLEIQIHTDLGNENFKRFSTLNFIRIFMSKFVLPRADHVRVVSNRIKDYVKRFIDETKIEIRPIKVDIDIIKNTPINIDLHKKYPQFEKIVLMASRIEKEKNIDMAIRAFSRLNKMRQNVGLIIVGSGKEKPYLINLAKKLNISNSVIFEDWNNDIVSYYKTCDIFLLTSWYEGYGMSLVEAQACGAKVVSTDVGIAKELSIKTVKYDEDSIAWGIMEYL